MLNQTKALDDATTGGEESSTTPNTGGQGLKTKKANYLHEWLAQ